MFVISGDPRPYLPFALDGPGRRNIGFIPRAYAMIILRDKYSAR